MESLHNLDPWQSIQAELDLGEAGKTPIKAKTKSHRFNIWNDSFTVREITIR